MSDQDTGKTLQAAIDSCCVTMRTFNVSAFERELLREHLAELLSIQKRVFERGDRIQKADTFKTVET